MSQTISEEFYSKTLKYAWRDHSFAQMTLENQKRERKRAKQSEKKNGKN